MYAEGANKHRIHTHIRSTLEVRQCHLSWETVSLDTDLYADFLVATVPTTEIYSTQHLQLPSRQERTSISRDNCTIDMGGRPAAQEHH